MTRIIGGHAGSLPLKVPPEGTRPTSDRVREAVFSSLDAVDGVRGAHVADLYAGSGAFGLEAASRDAASVTLVESAARAAAVCRSNARAVERALPRQIPIRVERQRVRAWEDNASPHPPLDLVFLDPPYDLDESSLADDLARLAGLLADDAHVLVERSSRSPEPEWPASLLPERAKRYGETVVWRARPRV